MKRLLIAALAATTFTAGIGAADAAEFFYRYRGMGPQIASADTEEPQAPDVPSAMPGRLVTPVFNWDRGGIVAGDGTNISIWVFVPDVDLFIFNLDPSSDLENFTVSKVAETINATTTAGSSAGDLPFTASAEDGRLVLTTHGTGSAACIEIMDVMSTDPSASIGFSSVPMICGTEG
jgi:hypothetical protein